MTDDVLEYLKDCYSFNLDPAVKAAIDEIERLRKKCDKQAMILRRLTPEQHPDTIFISGIAGDRDMNNMPEKLLVCPAYGCDFSYIYERIEKTTGPEW
jgi:hypothetical protein